jgi:hypothetical protein
MLDRITYHYETVKIIYVTYWILLTFYIVVVYFYFRI